MKVTRIILGLILFLLVFPDISIAVDKEEIQYGFYADRTIVSTRTIIINEALDKRITEIGNRIAKTSEKADIKYTFRVTNDRTINAYSAAGGFVYVNTGLLDILESVDELAAVMSHELAHINNNHQINFLYAANRTKIAGQVAGAFLAIPLGALGALSGDPTDIVRGLLIGSAIGDVIIVSMVKGYGKEQELEADALAVQYLKKDGYDPYALIGVFKKLETIKNRLGINEKNYVSSLINAEPGLTERIKNVEMTLNLDKNKQKKEEK